MKKRLFIIHGYRDKPDHGWMKWLKTEAEKLGYEVIAPQMPIGKIPNLKNWVKTAAKAIGRLDSSTVLIGHSLGTYTLLKYLAVYKGGPSEEAKALILVAGFIAPGRGSADIFFKPAPNISKVKNRIKNVYHIISNDDTSVLPAKSLELAEQLGGEKFVFNDYGHFLNKNTPKIPILLKILKSLD